MKHAKKLLGLLLALVMVFAMATTAFATGETGAIIVDNPQKDQNYTAYKIFDVVYNADKSAYSYTISGDSEWFHVVMDADGASKIPGLTFAKAYSEDVYVVTRIDTFSAAAFANTLKDNIEDKTGIPLEIAAGKATADNLPLGYYFVTSTSGALCNLTTTNPSVTIHDKNEVTFEKTDDMESVEIGETVHYTITSKVPDTTGFTNYDYVITDKIMSKGLTLDKTSIQIWLSEDNELITKETTGKVLDSVLDPQYYEKTTENAKGFDGTTDVDFRIDIEAKRMNDANPSLYGQYIFITYSATVNENAIATMEKNNAALTYSNDPTDHTKHNTITEEETVYSARIVIDKYAKQADETDKTHKLAGAEFVLYREATPAGAAEVTKMYYKFTPAAGAEKAKVEWVTARDQATKVRTDDEGAANFDGLKDGTYYLEETAAPAGYNLLPDPVEIVINGASATETDLSTLTHTERVANNTGSILPATGGMGTTLFYVVGAILFIGATVLLITKKRVKED